MKHIIGRLGPGLLYAGAAVGVSHLIQSTRAGTDYGLIMILVVLSANFLKYPFFKAGPLYAATEGKSLLTAFNNEGNWAMGLFYFVTISAMFTVQAVVTLICASVLSSIFNIQLQLWAVSAILLLVCLFILAFGKYSLLSRLMKYVIILLSITSFITFCAAYISYKTPTVQLLNFSFFERTDLLFLIALIGWMPAPLDISIWHSEWTLTANRGEKSERKIALFDFNIGYWGTTLLALIFVCLGTFILRGKGVELPSSGVAFAGNLLDMYTSTLGKWSFAIVAIAAFTTMFSTTLTVLDAYPRVLTKAIKLTFPKSNLNYSFWLIIIALGALAVLVFKLINMKQLVDFATTVSFLTAPVLAILIYKVVKKSNFFIFSKLDWFVAKLGIAILVIFSLVYLYLIVTE